MRNSLMVLISLLVITLFNPSPAQAIGEFVSAEQTLPVEPNPDPGPSDLDDFLSLKKVPMTVPGYPCSKCETRSTTGSNGKATKCQSDETDCSVPTGFGGWAYACCKKTSGYTCYLSYDPCPCKKDQTYCKN